MTKYSVYVRYIRQSLKDNRVSVEDLRSDLLTMPAINHAEQELALLSAHKAELKKATSLNDIFDLLTTEYASFLNYDIFQFIVDTNQIDHGQEELKYPEQLKAYLEKCTVSDFNDINPPQESKELVLKFNIKLSTKLNKFTDLKPAIAEILGINPTTLQLRDIKDGCVVVTFLILTPVADIVFNKHRVLTKEQEEQFQALSVLWLTCNGYTSTHSV